MTARFMTAVPFRAAFKIANKELQQKVEHAAEEILRNPLVGKPSRLGRHERRVEVNGHTLPYAYNPETHELVFLELYPARVFFK